MIFEFAKRFLYGKNYLFSDFFPYGYGISSDSYKYFSCKTKKMYDNIGERPLRKQDDIQKKRRHSMQGSRIKEAPDCSGRKGRRFRRLSIHTQFLVISSCSLVMVIMISLLLLKTSQRIFVSNVTNYANLFTEKYSNELDTLCLQLDALCSQFQTNEVYTSLLSAKSYQELTPQIISEVDENINYIKFLNAGIEDISFVNQLIHWSTLFSEEDLNAMYEQTLQDSTGGGHGLGLMKSSFLSLSNKNYYVYSSTIYSYGKPIGCAFISLDIDKLQLDSNEDSPASFFIMDANGNVYGLSSNSYRFTETVLDACQQYIGLLSGSDEPYTVNHDSLYIQMVYSEAAGCYLISAIHIPTIEDMLNNISYYIWFILAVVILFVLLITAVLYCNMIMPLNQFSGIIKKMHSQRQRHLKDPLDIDGCAEVHNLALAFSNMFSDIDELNGQIFEASARLYEEKIRAQATQIDYFRSQINPHFLYNVLELIRSLALTHSAPDIASIAVAVGKMYRYNTKGNPVVPFTEELEMTKAYIEIQKFRFQDKFDVFFNIPQEALRLPVIKLILQPIVENAIQHGIEPALKHCILYIGCTVTESDFIVEVRDDGVGMESKKLSEMQSLLAKKQYDAANYVGITNTNARLKLQYGEEYGITIDSVENDGTVVTLRMPRASEQL